ncbi:hypothetical protein FVEG_16674 [Fusarium verticillioides 7600]|uniref:AB hydrolase-1 domain-containing protein n=1 Tax=Gibberella moniliformis (strain M3125 / FGSC 7600) TaxID=334819 RepID=W7MIE5_GIBM7|nr:hypothetical protein FVEG_16674 [Fusarium verticillioides 7600]EWG50671.1 hypothetical protein FVEG_16674 [Fusarium verticillioides 7600]
MALKLPARQTFTARSGNVYSYIFIPPTSQSTTLLFLHGFPSTLTDWVHQIQHFSSEGYGVIALDLLGYGESSKPTDVHAYRLKSMGDEVIELLDHLNLKTIVGIGHDFGATLLSRMAAYHPSRWEALVFLAVGPPKLGTPFDVDMINTMTKQFLGYEMLGYIPWLADFTTQEILEKNAETAMSLVFCRDREEWETWFHPLGKMEEKHISRHLVQMMGIKACVGGIVCGKIISSPQTNKALKTFTSHNSFSSSSHQNPNNPPLNSSKCFHPGPLNSKPSS